MQASARSFAAACVELRHPYLLQRRLLLLLLPQVAGAAAAGAVANATAPLQHLLLPLHRTLQHVLQHVDEGVLAVVRRARALEPLQRPRQPRLPQHSNI